MNILYDKQKFHLLEDLEDEILTILKNNNARIAGGAIRAVFANEKIADYDVYVKNEHAFMSIQKILEEKYKKQFETDNAVSYEGKNCSIQLIKKYFGLSSEELLNKFDFTICMGLFDFETDSFVFNERFLLDVCSRRLIFNISAEYPISSLYRIRKYIKRGYTISGTEIVKIALAINNLKLYTYHDLKNQLQGIDTLFLKELTDVLMTPEYIDKKYDFNEFLNLLSEYECKKLEEVLE